jgi:hypothetical protein
MGFIIVVGVFAGLGILLFISSIIKGSRNGARPKGRPHAGSRGADAALPFTVDGGGHHHGGGGGHHGGGFGHSGGGHHGGGFDMGGGGHHG